MSTADRRCRCRSARRRTWSPRTAWLDDRRGDCVRASLRLRTVGQGAYCVTLQSHCASLRASAIARGAVLTVGRSDGRSAPRADSHRRGTRPTSARRRGAWRSAEASRVSRAFALAGSRRGGGKKGVWHHWAAMVIEPDEQAEEERDAPAGHARLSAARRRILKRVSRSSSPACRAPVRLPISA